MTKQKHPLNPSLPVGIGFARVGIGAVIIVYGLVIIPVTVFFRGGDLSVVLPMFCTGGLFAIIIGSLLINPAPTPNPKLAVLSIMSLPIVIIAIVIAIYAFITVAPNDYLNRGDFSPFFQTLGAAFVVFIVGAWFFLFGISHEEHTSSGTSTPFYAKKKEEATPSLFAQYWARTGADAEARDFQRRGVQTDQWSENAKTSSEYINQTIKESTDRFPLF